MLHKKLSADSLFLEPFVKSLANSSSGIASIAGTAVFITPNATMVPHALLHSLKHYKSLHQRVIILTAETLDIPHLTNENFIESKKLDDRFYVVKVKFGFMETPDLPAALEKLNVNDFVYEPMDTSFFVGRETLIPKIGSEMAYWREKLFIAIYRNAGSAASYFRLPPNRVIELGTQVEL